MKLTLDQVKKITKGAVRFEETEEGIRLYRFSKEQEILYSGTNETFYKQTFANAGMKFLFKTNSESLYLDLDLDSKTSRKYFSFDVFVEDELIGCLDNFKEEEMPVNYTTIPLPYGRVNKSFNLGKGSKTVEIYLPWNFQCTFKEIAIDDNAYIEEVKLDKKALVYGDSITQGYDAMRPSNRYVAKLMDFIGAEEVNKAIGGEFFFPPLVHTEEDFVPDLITVAYGTNDWSKTDEPGFRVRSREFYETLSKKYPNAKIFAITPIWRKDYQEYREFGLFEEMEQDLVKAVEGLENVHLIYGFNFVPKEEAYFADLRLHPNDAGFDHYFIGLCAEIQKYLS